MNFHEMLHEFFAGSLLRTVRHLFKLRYQFTEAFDLLLKPDCVGHVPPSK